jgi:ABC-type nickel/cobalt efflux system permease component RcnA
MNGQSGLLLLVGVATVGVLHTIVPDHWAPIVILARQQGWSLARTARAAALAGLGHVTSTLLLGALLWIAGAVLAVRYAHLVSVASAAALIAFGLWIAYGGWKEIREKHHHEHDRGHSHYEHGHPHRHPDGDEHVHWHEHHEEDWHAPEGRAVEVHAHGHNTSGRMALLLILGSSPMVEGIPLFFNASTKGIALLGGMAAVFGLSTILTYVAMCVAGTRGLQRTSLGPLEKYGEVLSGLFVAAVGVYAALSS